MGSHDGKVMSFDVASGRLKREFQAHTGQVRALAVMADERFVVTGSQDQTARVSDVRTGAPVRVFRNMASVIDGIAVSADEKVLATTAAGGEVAVWSLHNEPQRWTQRVEARIYHHSWSPDGRWLATACKSGAVHVWNSKTGELRRVMPAYAREATSAVFNADGSRLATSSYDGRIRLYAVPSFELLSTLELGGRAWRLNFSSDGAWVTAAAFNGHAAVWDISGELVQRFEPVAGHRAWWALLFDGPDDSKRLATYGWGSGVVVREVGSGKVVFSPDAPSGEPAAFALADKTKIAATGSSAGELVLWDLDAGQQLARVQAHEGLIRGVRVDSAGKQVLTYGRDGRAKLWNARTGELMQTLAGHEGGLWVPAISPDGTLVATVADDDTVRVWRTDDGERLHTFPTAVGFLGAVAFSPDSQRLSVTTNQGGITVWRIDRGREAAEVLEQIGRATNLRTCRDSFETVRVVPFPKPDAVWAPAELCR